MKIYKKCSSTIFLASLLTLTGTASAANSLKIFDGFIAFKSLQSMKIEKALAEIAEVNSSRLTTGDYNNICVAHAINREFSEALEACSKAEDLAKTTRGFPKTGLRDIKSNLAIVTEKIKSSALANTSI